MQHSFFLFTGAFSAFFLLWSIKHWCLYISFSICLAHRHRGKFVSNCQLKEKMVFDFQHIAGSTPLWLFLIFIYTWHHQQIAPLFDIYPAGVSRYVI